MFVERKIIGTMKGEAERHFDALSGLKDLKLAVIIPLGELFKKYGYPHKLHKKIDPRSLPTPAFDCNVSSSSNKILYICIKLCYNSILFLKKIKKNIPTR